MLRKFSLKTIVMAISALVLTSQAFASEKELLLEELVAITEAVEKSNNEDKTYQEVRLILTKVRNKLEFRRSNKFIQEVYRIGGLSAKEAERRTAEWMFRIFDDERLSPEFFEGMYSEHKSGDIGAIEAMDCALMHIQGMNNAEMQMYYEKFK